MKSYLKFLSRNKLYAAIQALGLVVSLAFVIVIACYTWQQLAITRDAPDHKRIYALTGGGEYLSAWPGELAAVQDRIPDIEAAAGSIPGPLPSFSTVFGFPGILESWRSTRSFSVFCPRPSFPGMRRSCATGARSFWERALRGGSHRMEIRSGSPSSSGRIPA